MAATHADVAAERVERLPGEHKVDGEEPDRDDRDARGHADRARRAELRARLRQLRQAGCAPWTECSASTVAPIRFPITKPTAASQNGSP